MESEIVKDSKEKTPLGITLSRLKWEEDEATKWIVIGALQGIIPVGSLGNDDVLRIHDTLNPEMLALLQEMPKNTGHRAFLILDFTEALYEFGDHIGSLWIMPMAKGLRPLLVAQEPSKTALSSLLAHSIPVPILETREEALYLIKSTLW